MGYFVEYWNNHLAVKEDLTLLKFPTTLTFIITTANELYHAISSDRFLCNVLYIR